MQFLHTNSAALLCTVLTVVLCAQKPPATPASDETTISASGHVTAGVEAGCLMPEDSKTKTLYNLYFGKGKKPPLGSLIRFTGRKHDGPTACMQGQPVDVTRWTLSKSPPEDDKKKM